MASFGSLLNSIQTLVCSNLGNKVNGRGLGLNCRCLNSVQTLAFKSWQSIFEGVLPTNWYDYMLPPIISVKTNLMYQIKYPNRHWSQPLHLGKGPKTTTGSDRELTINVVTQIWSLTDCHTKMSVSLTSLSHKSTQPHSTK